MKEEEQSQLDPINVVFIHGIGNQVRYGPQSDFVSGLISGMSQKEDCPNQNFEITATNGDGAGDSIALLSKFGKRSRLIKVTEVYWAAMLFRSTTVPRVLAWILNVLIQLMPWSKSNQRAGRATGHGVSSLRLRWLGLAAYAALALSLLFSTLFFAVSASVLAIDQTATIGRFQSDVKDLSMRATLTAAHGSETSQADSNELTSIVTDIRTKFEQLSDNLGALGIRDDALNAELENVRGSLVFDEVPTPTVKGKPGIEKSKSGEQLKVAKDVQVAIDNGTRLRARSSSFEGPVTFLTTATTHLFNRGALADDALVTPFPDIPSFLQGIPWKPLALALVGVLAFWVGIGGIGKSLTSLVHPFRSPSIINLLSIIVLPVILLLAGWLLTGRSVIALNIALAISLYRVSYSFVNIALAEILGDIATFCQPTSHVSAKLREDIIERAVKQISDVAQNSDMPIVVVAHSLGAVIGLAALRRLYVDYAVTHDRAKKNHPYAKIAGFVTLGSPIEKVIHFFEGEQGGGSFKEFTHEVSVRTLSCSPRPSASIPWTNFHMTLDPISDPMRSFQDHGNKDLFSNIKVEPPLRTWIWPHSIYWYLPDFQKGLAKFLIEEVH